ncbi:MAG TPA: hypothetical protein PKD09_22465 [Aggregatilinea sp.]|uniref:hypothetical protein n=1 Tax=Aggregatilinea sp. TaxID=2806333 RepID=UPI002D102999|nr:hypothetical protein [Aggregatilinea sp.]HML24435.1 hypothetical protein [Aggregatilinea sp.]
MADEQTIHIVSWPPEPARLAHEFAEGDPLSVSVGFEDTPAHVIVASLPERPLQVAMNMALRAAEPVPLCISLCEPICIDSSYTIGITIFDRPVISITIRGRTRLSGCREEL